MKLACFDIDGTLLPSYKEKIPNEVVEAIQEFARRGNAIAIASGRPFGSCRSTLNLFKAEYRFAVCAGGSSLYNDEGKLLWKKTMSKEAFLHIRKELSKYEGVSVYAYLGDDSLASYSPEPWADFEFSINSFHAHYDLSKDDSVLDRYGVAKIMIASKPEISAKIRFSSADELNYTIVRSNEHFLEALPKGVSKASGIEPIRELLGIKREDVYTFGDSGNDLEMIRTYQGVAMGNAMDEVKAVAKYVTKSCKEAGVAYALKEILHLI